MNRHFSTTYSQQQLSEKLLHIHSCLLPFIDQQYHFHKTAGCPQMHSANFWLPGVSTEYQMTRETKAAIAELMLKGNALPVMLTVIFTMPWKEYDSN